MAELMSGDEKLIETRDDVVVVLGSGDASITAVEIDSSGEITKLGQDTPTDQQVLTWDDANSRAVWNDGSSGVSAVANGVNNRIATFSSTTAINGEANLTFDGSTFTVAAATAVDLQTDALSIGENGDTDVVVTFNGNTSDGTLTWMEDESEFRFNSSVRGKLIHFTQHVFNKNSGTSLIYIPLNTTTDQANFEEYSSWVAPHDGKLLKVMVRPKGYSSNFGGSTVIGLHINRNASAAQTVTATLGSDATVTYAFTSNNTFSAGDLLALSMDVSTAPGDVNVVAVWEYDTTT